MNVSNTHTIQPNASPTIIPTHPTPSAVATVERSACRQYRNQQTKYSLQLKC